MIRLIIIITALLSFFVVEGQQTTDFNHRSIEKKLRKYGCSREVKLQKLFVPTSIEFSDDRSAYFYVNDPDCNNEVRFVFVGRVNTCRSGGCAAHYGESQARHFEYFDYFIVFDRDGNVETVKVFRYEATHGHEITAKRWLKQFQDYNGKEDIVVGKDIDGITGATTSVHSISYDIQERTRRIKRVKKFYLSFLALF